MKNNIALENRENANSKKYNGDDAFALLDNIDELYVRKGRKYVHFNLHKEKPVPEDIAKLMLGPTGNFRAPAIRKDRTLVVGFYEDALHKLFSLNNS